MQYQDKANRPVIQVQLRSRWRFIRPVAYQKRSVAARSHAQERAEIWNTSRTELVELYTPHHAVAFRLDAQPGAERLRKLLHVLEDNRALLVV